GEEDQGLRISEEERIQEEEEADELYRYVDINQGRGLQVSQDIEDSHVTLTPVHPDESSSVSSFVTSMLNPTSNTCVESIFMTASSPIAPLPTPTPIMTPSTISTITTSSEAPIPPTIIPSAVLENLLTFDSVFSFEDRVKSLEVNFLKFMQTNQFAKAVSKILVKSQIKEQVSRILPRIEESVNAQLEAEVLSRSSNSSRTSYVVAADLTEMELNKTLIEKMEGNKDTAILKRRRGDDDDQEGPSAGSDQGSKRRREGGEHESASTPSEPATRSASRSTTGTQSRQMSASESAFVEEPVPTTCQMDETPHSPRKPLTPDHDWNKTMPTIQGSAQTWISELAKQVDSRSSFNELLDTLIDFSNFIMNRLCEPLNYDKHALWGVSHWGRKRQQFYEFAVNRESALDVYSKRRIIAVTDLKIVEWHNYKHLDWISIRRDDDKIYKFKEGDFKRLRIQDIEDMLLLLV
nr:hypothetical protein [Tanacetum cinerariifolium]